MSMAFSAEKVGQDILIVRLITAEDPTNDEWSAFEAKLHECKRELDGNLLRLKQLIIGDGGAPNSKQRKSVVHGICEGVPVKVALVTNAFSDPVKRGVVTVFSWLNPGFRAFQPEELRQALAHLDVAPGLDFVWERCRRLQSELPPVATLALAAKSVDRPRLASAVDRAVAG